FGKSAASGVMSESMRQFLLVLAIAILPAAPATAQGAKDGACQTDKVAGPDALITACTTLLQSSNDVARQIEALVARASAYQKKKQGDRAIADLSRAIALDGNNLAALKARAEAYYLASQNDRAILDFNRVIRILPNDADIFDARGNAFLQSGSYDRA